MKKIKMKRTKKISEENKQKLRTKFFPKAEITLDAWFEPFDCKFKHILIIFFISNYKILNNK